MRIPRISLGALMFTVVFAGIVLAEIRAFLVFAQDSGSTNNSLYFAPSLLLVGNLAGFLLALRIPEVKRTGRLQARPFWWGFQAASWGALEAFGLMCLTLKDDLIDSYLFPPRSPILLTFNKIVAIMPGSKDFEAFLELVFLAIIFGGPILLLGLLGGLVAWALGIEVEVQFHRRRRGQG